MPPGRKRQPAEEPLTDYEKQRAENLLRNNQMLQSLGVSALASLVNSSHGKAKGKASVQSRLHESVRNNENEQDMTLGNEFDIDLTRNTFTSTGSKRVMALDDQDAPARRTRQRTRATEEGLQTTADASMGVDSPIEADDLIETFNEGQSSAMVQRPNRGRTMGKEVDRIARGLNAQIPVHIAEGKKRPEAPMQAAKLASESGIIVRQHMPILPHWKEYKKDQNYFTDFMGKISAQFAIDKENKAVKEACSDLLKSALRQQRYRLKKRYFNGLPANEVPTKSPVSTISDDQFRALVGLWSSEKHKETCAGNKRNREKVQLHQRTGSRSYIAHAHALKQGEKYKDVELDAINFFKESHNSTKTGLSENAKEALEQMVAIVNEPVEEGQVAMTPAEAVAQVLPSRSFLRNAGFETEVPKRSSKARVHELEAQVEAEKLVAAELKDKFEALNKKMEETEAARVKQMEELEQGRRKEEEARLRQQEEMDELRKQYEETNSVLRRVFGLGRE